MIVHNLYVECRAFLEAEADAPLVVNAYAPLAFTVALEWFQPVVRRDAQVVDTSRDVKLGQLSKRHTLNVCESADAFTAEQRGRIAALERFDHRQILT